MGKVLSADGKFEFDLRVSSSRISSRGDSSVIKTEGHIGMGEKELVARMEVNSSILFWPAQRSTDQLGSTDWLV